MKGVTGSGNGKDHSLTVSTCIKLSLCVCVCFQSRKVYLSAAPPSANLFDLRVRSRLSSEKGCQTWVLVLQHRRSLPIFGAAVHQRFNSSKFTEVPREAHLDLICLDATLWWDIVTAFCCSCYLGHLGGKMICHLGSLVMLVARIFVLAVLVLRRPAARCLGV